MKETVTYRVVCIRYQGDTVAITHHATLALATAHAASERARRNDTGTGRYYNRIDVQTMTTRQITPDYAAGER